jgi:hypothetical protein
MNGPLSYRVENHALVHIVPVAGTSTWGEEKPKKVALLMVILAVIELCGREVQSGESHRKRKHEGADCLYTYIESTRAVRPMTLSYFPNANIDCSTNPWNWLSYRFLRIFSLGSLLKHGGTFPHFFSFRKWIFFNFPVLTASTKCSMVLA